MLAATQPPGRTLPLSVLMLIVCLAIAGSVPALADPDPGARAGDSRIVYHTYRYGPAPQICIMDSDGTNITRLTFTDDYEQCPALSPVGTLIAFESTRNHITNHLYIMNVDGSSQHRVTTVSNEEAHAAWSPDGTHLACSVIVGGTYDIYTMNTDGTNRVRLTTDPAHDMAPDWSPDDTRILFTSLRGGHYEAYVMNTDGTDQTPLLSTPNDTYGAKWSPDGTQIVYVMDIPSPQHTTIHVFNLEGSGDITILDTTWSNFAPDWAPDGSRIAFLSLEYGSTAEICSMLPDGTDVQRVTFDMANNGPPSWGPTPATSSIEESCVRGAMLSLVNPVRDRADLRLSIEQAGPASLEVFDCTGRLVRTLLQESLTPGIRTVSWDGRDDAGRLVPSGVYHCRLVSGEASQTRKLVRVR
jgi:Tol biopolymer transport system component